MWASPYWRASPLPSVSSLSTRIAVPGTDTKILQEPLRARTTIVLLATPAGGAASPGRPAGAEEGEVGDGPGLSRIIPTISAVAPIPQDATVAPISAITAISR